MDTFRNRLVLSLLVLLGACGVPEAERVRLLSPHPEEQPWPNSVFLDEPDGTRLHGRIFEPASESGPGLRGLVVLIHGFGASTESWRGGTDLLAQAGWRVLALDLPPFGFSRTHGASDLSLGAAPARLNRWVQAYRVPGRPVVAVGHSLGGRAALLWARQFPEYLQALGLIAPALGSGSGSSAWLGWPPVSWLAAAYAQGVSFTRDSVRDLLRSAYGQEPGEADIDAYQRAFVRPGQAEAFVRFVSRPPEGPLEPWSPPLPTLVVWGLNDSWVPRDRVWPAWAAAGWVVEEALLEHVGHVPQETASSAVYTRLSAWLDGLFSPGP